MEDPIKNRLIEISKNHNGNRKRTIKDLEEVIDNLKDDQKQKRNADIIKAIGLVGIVFAFIFFVNATMSYNINGKTELRVGQGEVIVGDNMDSNNTYLRFDTLNNTPIDPDCNNTNHYGRAIVKYNGVPPSKNKLYLCTDDGWVSTVFN